MHGIRRRVGFGSLAGLLDALDADIICLQEVKMAALGALERCLAITEGWDSYFAICRTQEPRTSYGRYAGVATFCRSGVRPHAAAEGVTGVLGPPTAAGAAASDARDRELDGEGPVSYTHLTLPTKA